MVEGGPDVRTAHRAGSGSGSGEITAGDRHLVTDGEVVKTRHRTQREALQSGRRVGELLSQGAGRVGPAGVPGQRPGEPDLGHRTQPPGQPLDVAGEVGRT